MNASLQLCANCGLPAAYIWTLADGSEEPTCGRCRPASGVAAREIGADPVAAVAADAPLTVAEAGKREGVSIRTVYRWLDDGALEGGAWKTDGDSGTWRIDPAALDRLRARGPRTRKQPEGSTVPTPKVKPKKPTNPTAWTRP